ncbi:MAG TPA: pyridoxamine 5'-phosphate oxidase family protein [Actinomycetota bacterium]
MEAWESWLGERRLAVVATAGADGMPHAVPVEVVVDAGKAYVWCRASSVKARQAARSGTAAIVAYKNLDFVLLRGTARILTASDPSYERLTNAFLAKYERTETYGNDALIQITPERISART